ncbi:helix-turn-helix domain-containing protein [bacterium]|nr:helix-turn-helix domain-containing protein [bacterium]
MEKMLSVETVAERFNVSPRTVIRLIERRQIKALRVGRQWRISKEWLEEWLNQHTTDVAREDVG